jgi:hypothetical protein
MGGIRRARGEPEPTRLLNGLEGVMDFDPEAVACGHGNSKTIPKRRFRRRMGVCCPVLGARARGRSTAQPRFARGVRWTEVDRAHWLRLALYATRAAYTREAVYQQTRRWLEAGVFEEMVHDLRVLLRLSEGRAPDPTPTILDSRTLRCTPESGSRGGYDGAKRKKGTKVHAAVDTLRHLLALHVRAANEQERELVGKLAETVQEATGESVELAYVEQGYTGERGQLRKRRLMA